MYMILMMASFENGGIARHFFFFFFHFCVYLKNIKRFAFADFLHLRFLRNFSGISRNPDLKKYFTELQVANTIQLFVAIK